jgi:hypothetical protein
MCGSQSLQALGQFRAVDFDHPGHEVLGLGLAAAHRVRQHPRVAASNEAANLPPSHPEGAKNTDQACWNWHY